MFASLGSLLAKLKVGGLGRKGGRTEATPPTDAQGDLVGFICQSPLLANCGISPADVASNVGEWRRLGCQLAEHLQLPHVDQLDAFSRQRIFQYYLPVFFWADAQLAARRASGAPGPLVLGISAPQGCGKSTLCDALCVLFERNARSAAAVSVDDFYLTNADQRALAAAHPGNPLLELRGNAGTHDMALGTSSLRALRAATQPGATVPIPRYDKSAYQGRGDRADPSIWPSVPSPVDVVLFEGWMLGFRPLESEAVAAVDPHLIPVNDALRGYKEAWDSFADAWLVVRVDDPSYAHRWRLQAEQAQRAAGRPAMTDEEVKGFVDRFMPGYRAYLPGLYAAGPTTAQPGALLVVQVDEGRQPLAQQQPPPL